MPNKIIQSEEFNKILLMILDISNEIKNIKLQLGSIAERVDLIDEKVFKANTLSYDSTRSRSLDVSISLDRVNDD
jgi:hypothetical protein